jgi:hypothetical protein
MDTTAFGANTGNHQFDCPACERIHLWSKKDAWLQDGETFVTLPPALR